MTNFTRTTTNYPVDAPTAINRSMSHRDPVSGLNGDRYNFTPGDLWQNTVTRQWWIFLYGTNTSGFWARFTGGILTINNVGPDSTGNLTLTSTGGTITITNNPSTNNINIDTTGGFAIDKVNLDTGTTPIVPTAGAITLTGATVAAGTHPIRTDGTGVSTAAIEVQFTQAAAATDATKVGLAAFDSSVFTVDGNGFVGLVSGGVDLHAARFIVSAGGTADGANFTTIGAAYAAAAFAGAPQTVVVQPGTYTEDITGVPGIDIVGFGGNGQDPQVTIVGKFTHSTAGTITLSNIRFQTNGDFCIAVTGSAASGLNLYNCFINATNNTAITYTSTSASSRIVIDRCTADVTTTGITMWDMTSAGSLVIRYTGWNNTGSSVTASTQSAGFAFLNYNTFLVPIVTSGTASLGATHCFFSTPTLVTTPMTIGGTGVGNAHGWNQYFGGTAPALTVTAPASMVAEHCGFISSNAGGAVTGTGSIKYGTVDFAEDGNSKLISVTSQESINGTSFTPGVAFGGSSVGITYSQQTGEFTRVNDLVYVNIIVILTSKGAQTGTMTFTGLPFTVAGTGNPGATVAVGNITFAGKYLNAAFLAGTKTGQIINNDSGGPGGPLDDTAFANDSFFTVSGWYFI